MKLLFLLMLSASLLFASLGDPRAKAGGKITIGLSDFPKSFLVYLSNEQFTILLNSLVLQTLLERDPDTFHLIPSLASHWNLSKDKRSITVHLDPRARFSDGKNVTAADVKFTWDSLFNPQNKTARLQSYFSSFSSCEVVNESTVLFKMRNLHFRNLEKLADFQVLPKHIYAGQNFNRAFNQNVVGSGPYRVRSVELGSRITLKKVPDFWGTPLYQNQGRYNFEEMVLRSIPEYDVQFEMFKKGDLDYFYFLSSKMWEKEAVGPLFDKHLILKTKAINKMAPPILGVAWNLRRPLFQDRRVRLALSYLWNRDFLINEILYRNYEPVVGLTAANSPYRSPKLDKIPYDPQKAKALLTAAGWNKISAQGLLTKEGKPFEFELLNDNTAFLRVLTPYQEDLKQMGIKMNIRTTDWATSLKLVDDRQFDATILGRTRENEPSDFCDTWGSKEADIKGSANLTGYKNSKVDVLCEKIDTTWDRNKRIFLVRELDEIISADQPLSYGYEQHHFRIGFWNRFSFPGKGYFNYSIWSDCFQYWWWDKVKDDKLVKARAQGKAIL